MLRCTINLCKLHQFKNSNILINVSTHVWSACVCLFVAIVVSSRTSEWPRANWLVFYLRVALARSVIASKQQHNSAKICTKHMKIQSRANENAMAATGINKLYWHGNLAVYQQGGIMLPTPCIKEVLRN